MNEWRWMRRWMENEDLEKKSGVVQWRGKDEKKSGKSYVERVSWE